MVNMGNKYFYLIESETSCKIILISNHNQNETFKDMMTLLNKCPECIYKIIMNNNNLNKNFESQIQIIVSKNEFNSMYDAVKNLKFIEIGGGYSWRIEI